MCKGTVLVVDLDDRTLQQTTSVLRDAGFATLPTRLCVNDVSQVLHAKPDLIVMDACRHCLHRDTPCADLRARCGIGGTPVILLTERCDIADHDCAFKAGVQKYLIKPCAPQELVLAVEELLERRREDPGADAATERVSVTCRTG